MRACQVYFFYLYRRHRNLAKHNKSTKSIHIDYPILKIRIRLDLNI